MSSSTKTRSGLLVLLDKTRTGLFVILDKTRTGLFVILDKTRTGLFVILDKTRTGLFVILDKTRHRFICHPRQDSYRFICHPRQDSYDAGRVITRRSCSERYGTGFTVILHIFHARNQFTNNPFGFQSLFQPLGTLFIDIDTYRLLWHSNSFMLFH